MEKLVLISMFFLGCTEYPKKYVNITHNHIYKTAIDICKSHQGFHYIVHIRNIKSKRTENGNMDDFPCENTFKVRCEDNTLHNIKDGIDYCFIAMMQLEETMKEF